MGFFSLLDILYNLFNFISIKLTFVWSTSRINFLYFDLQSRMFLFCSPTYPRHCLYLVGAMSVFYRRGYYTCLFKKRYFPQISHLLCCEINHFRPTWPEALWTALLQVTYVRVVWGNNNLNYNIPQQRSAAV